MYSNIFNIFLNLFLPYLMKLSKWMLDFTISPPWSGTDAKILPEFEKNYFKLHLIRWCLIWEAVCVCVECR